MRKDAVLNTRVNTSVKAKLRTIALARGESMSTLITTVLIEYLNNN